MLILPHSKYRFFVFVVDTFIFACRGSRPEIEVAMEVENEQLTEIIVEIENCYVHVSILIHSE